jgi:hypothetical protein
VSQDIQTLSLIKKVRPTVPDWCLITTVGTRICSPKI